MKKIFRKSCLKKVLLQKTTLVIPILYIFLYCFSDESRREQESPPAGNRKRRTARGITCPSITYSGGGGEVPHPWRGGGVSHPDLAMGGGTPSWPGGGYPILTWLGDTSPWDTPRKGHGTSGSIIGWRWGTPMLTGRHLENITSRRTTYAGGKNKSSAHKNCNKTSCEGYSYAWRCTLWTLTQWWWIKFQHFFQIN